MFEEAQLVLIAQLSIEIARRYAYLSMCLIFRLEHFSADCIILDQACSPERRQARLLVASRDPTFPQHPQVMQVDRM